jgi:S-DNA-T family DNA segregation ATPase FtsK/SpoIIIE
VELRLQVRTRAQDVVPVRITCDPETTAGALATALAQRHPGIEAPGANVTLAVGHGKVMHQVPPGTWVSEAGIQSGQTVSVVPSTDVASGSGVAATVRVVSGPDEGAEFPVPAGSSFIGRDPTCRVRLSDPMTSMVHARLFVGSDVEVFDQNSSNGVEVGGVMVQQAPIRPAETVRVGNTLLEILATPGGQAEAQTRTVVPFNRPPRLDPDYEGKVLIAPEVPKAPTRTRMPIIPLILPILMGGVLYLLTRSVASIVFVALSPLLMLGMAVESMISGKRRFKRDAAAFRADVAALSEQAVLGADVERAARCHEYPSLGEYYAAAAAKSDLLWCRRPGLPRYLSFRLGLGTSRSRDSIDAQPMRGADLSLQAELDDVVAGAAQIDGVPVVLDLTANGSFGVAGSWDRANSAARAVVLQAALSHAPDEVMIAALIPPHLQHYWNWLLWLPHVEAAERALGTTPLAAGGGPGTTLAAAIDRVIRERIAADVDLDDENPPPRLIVVIAHDAPVPRPALVAIAEDGPAVGVHVVWVAEDRGDLPAACRAYLSRHDDEDVFGLVATGESTSVTVEEVGVEEALAAAGQLAPVVDSSQSDEGMLGIPTSVSFLDISGTALAESADAIIDRWRESDSLPADADQRQGRRRESNLRALVGVTATGPLQLDLRSQGPHALVGGTTGSGKSEFLQSWVLGMAAAHSPRQVTFLLVDYKGGSAFADCVRLPHTVGLVTDLSPAMVRRALISLNAELRHREQVLQRGGFKDLAEMEKADDPDTPPSLVIVVDEFAALVQEVPEFVDGVVNVAQRGRSLGLHLILATQRPAGVIKDNLRANTNLRIALRVADAADSQDIVGDALAAGFDPGIPGRAVFTAGGSRLTLFQSAYVGGFTSPQKSEPTIDVAPLQFAPAEDWPVIEPAAAPMVAPASTRKDVQRIVDTIELANSQAALAAPRKPWLPRLADVYDLTALPSRRTDEELVFGVRDDPEAQDQPVVAFLPDRDGAMAVYGTGGSGTSGFLRTLAVCAGLTTKGGPCHVYGLDFGARGLSPVEVLPHVGSIVNGEDDERVTRLARWLRGVVDERAIRYSAANAGTIAEYRRLAGMPDEPRILLLIDGMDAFRNAYEITTQSKVFEQVLSIAADGRPVGVHVVVAADRPGAIPSALASSLQARMVMRMANDNDLMMLGIPRDLLQGDTPPGRGVVDGQEVQVAVLGRDPSAPGQAAALARLSESMRRAGVVEAPPIGRLPVEVTLADLPVEVDGLPTLGVADDTLAATGFPDIGVFVVCGPPHSGRTTALTTVVASLRRARPNARLAFFGNRGSSLLQGITWDEVAATEQDAATLATTLLDQVAADSVARTSLVVVIEGIGDFISTPADLPLQKLVKACRSSDQLVIAEGETSSLGGSWPLLQAVKAARSGIALQPDQLDGDSVFRTSFPRINRSSFPEGRGLRVSSGRVTRVQVALP